MKHYAVYGNDHQEKLQELWDDEENIQKVADYAIKKKLEERKKAYGKKKAIDSTVNSEKPGDVEDVIQSKPVKKPDTKKKDKKKSEENEHKANKTIFIGAGVLLGIIVVVSVI